MINTKIIFGVYLYILVEIEVYWKFLYNNINNDLKNLLFFLLSKRKFMQKKIYRVHINIVKINLRKTFYIHRKLKLK